MAPFDFLKTVDLRDGRDTLLGISTAQLATITRLDGGKGEDTVTLQGGSTLSAGQLANFEIVKFEGAGAVSWTVGSTAYMHYAFPDDPNPTPSGPDNEANTVTVDASGLTAGGLTFDATALASKAFSFDIKASSGVDTFTYTNLKASLVTGMDTIRNFTSGTDKIDVTGSIATVADVAAGVAVDKSALGTQLGTALTGIVANTATVVTFTGGEKYLVINDATGGFDAATDAVIALAGTSTIAAGDFM